MKYTSTRDASVVCTFEEALLSGYAPDGGLFVPQDLPKIDAQTLQKWSSLSFAELAFAVLRQFIDDKLVPDRDLRDICNSSFVDGFPTDRAIPIDKSVPGLYIVELFHGPTFCFKDFGMRAVVHLLAYFARKRNLRITLLVSTTGDTGPAAVQAVQDVADKTDGPSPLSILVHYPKQQISTLQRKQMTTAASDRIHVVTYEGGGDDMDEPIKRILADHRISNAAGNTEQPKRIICGVNSYNIGRPLVQMTHWIWTYLRVVEDLNIAPGDPDTLLDIVVPTGAMGNIAGGYMAKRMGLPLGTLIAAVNINDTTHTAMQMGVLARTPTMLKTISEAINIQLPYNFERLLFYLTGGHHALIKQWYTDLQECGRIDLGDEWHNKLKDEFRSDRVTDTELCATMTKVYTNFGYYADPHTGVALCAAERLNLAKLDKENKTDMQLAAESLAGLNYDHCDRDDENNETSTEMFKRLQHRPVAIMATASPCKFQKAVTTALGTGVWKKYVDAKFPLRARELMEREEKPPTIYRFAEGKSLAEVQVGWQKLAENIIATL